jgi:hypothetical protein
MQCINGVSSNPVEGRTKIWQLKNQILTLFGLIFRRIYIYIYNNRIDGVMVSRLASSTVDREFESWSGQTKVFKICSFSNKHSSLRRKSKDWLARNQDNVSEWSDMSIHRLLIQWASTIKIQQSVLVKYKADPHQHFIDN